MKHLKKLAQKYAAPAVMLCAAAGAHATATTGTSGLSVDFDVLKTEVTTFITAAIPIGLLIGGGIFAIKKGVGLFRSMAK